LEKEGCPKAVSVVTRPGFAALKIQNSLSRTSEVL
jgi:hypothetical protein